MKDQNLVDREYQLIATLSKSKADAWLDDFHNSGVLRVYMRLTEALNHYWRVRLSGIDGVTFAAYVSLDDRFCDDTWLTCFKMDILPLLQRYDFAE